MTVQIVKPAPLRIGIIIDSVVQPRWVRKCLENILALNVAKLELVVRVRAESKGRDSLLYKLYDRMERSIFGAPSAMEEVRIDDLLGSVATCDDDDTINACNLDVLINLGPLELNSRFASLAKHGIWFYRFGSEVDPHRYPPGFREVMTQDPITLSSLQCIKGETQQTVYQSVSPTLSRFSVGANNNSCYWKAAAFAARSLVNLSEGHNSWPVNETCRSESSLRSPTNGAMTGMFLSLSERAAVRAIEKLSSFEQWVLAYRFNEGEFKYLIPDSDRFWADPFPIKVDDKYFVFFEDYLNAAGRAHISMVEIAQSGMVSSPTQVLNLDCHLSYPFVFEWLGNYYMIPETGDKNAVQLYRASSFPFEWQLESVLLEANCPLDATLIEVSGTWWMFVNIQEKGVAVNWDELHLYYANGPLGPWKPHARNPVVSDVRSARPAGRLFWSNNVLYRPSQDSSIRYGYATTINRVKSLSPSEYEETAVAKILPHWDRNIIGTHTFNAVDEITVIDCLTKRSRFRVGSFSVPEVSLDL